MSWLESLISKIRPGKNKSDYGGYSYDDPDYDPVVRRGGALGEGNPIAEILLFPFRVIFWPFTAFLGLFHNTGVVAEDMSGASLGEKARHYGKRFGRGLVTLPGKLLSAPIHLFRGLLAGDLREALFVLPALMTVSLFIFVFVQVFARQEVIKNRYSRGFSAAMAKEEYRKAKTYYQRMIEHEQPSLPQKFHYSLALAKTGEPEKANNLIDSLAPEDNMGFGPAHVLKAQSLSAQLIQGNQDPEILKKLRWHLRNSHEVTPEIQVTWARYHLAMDEPQEAIKALEKVADRSPQIYEMIATIYAQMGSRSDQRMTLAKVEEIYRETLDRDKLNHQVRVSLANVLTGQEKFKEAEELLLKGIQKRPNEFIRRALATFYIVRHDVAIRDNEPIQTQLNYLIGSLQQDANFGPVYQRLVKMYMDTNKTPESGEIIYKALSEVVAGDKPSPIAHFAISNVLWQMGEKTKAQFHIERAYELDNNFIVVLNNLAWMLAHAEEPDLDRALELSKVAVERVPLDPRFHDTLGTILMKQGKYQEAIKEFEIALPAMALPEIDAKKSIHEKLAIIYDELEMSDLARIHRRRSKGEQQN